MSVSIKRKLLIARIDDKAFIRLEIGAGNVKPAFQLWDGTALDFNGPEFAARQREDKINFDSSRSAIKIRLCSVRGGANQRFRHEAFPCRSGDGVAKQRFFVPDAQ